MMAIQREYSPQNTAAAFEMLGRIFSDESVDFRSLLADVLSGKAAPAKGGQVEEVTMMLLRKVIELQELTDQQAALLDDETVSGMVEENL